MKFFEIERGEMLNIAAIISYSVQTKPITKTVNTPAWGKEQVPAGDETVLAIKTAGKTHTLRGTAADKMYGVLAAESVFQAD